MITQTHFGKYLIIGDIDDASTYYNVRVKVANKYGMNYKRRVHGLTRKRVLIDWTYARYQDRIWNVVNDLLI